MRLVREVPLRLRHASLARVALGLLVGLSAMGFCIAPEIMSGFGTSKAQLARATVHSYAHEAYTIWRLQNPAIVCPPNIKALAALVGHRDDRDPYGEPHELYCTDRGIYVHSRGEDAVGGTADDIWSHSNR